MKKTFITAAAVVVLVILVSCAPGPNTLTGTPGETGKVAGFWQGLWHGFIVLFTFLVSLFYDGMRMYEVHNSGNGYNLGFLLGMMIFFGGGCGGAGRCSRK